MTSSVKEDSLNLARAAVESAADKKASNILLLDLRSLSTVADYFVICSGSSERQLRAISDSIDESVEKTLQESPHSKGGSAGSGWVLMDYGAVIIHIFLPSQRQYYNLESLWAKAPVLLRMQ
jgi:ribosome-associated protein